MPERRRDLLTLTILLLLLAAPACASMQQRVSESEKRSNTLEAQVADLQATQQTIITRLNQLRQDLEAALDPVRAQQASGGADLRSLQAEVTSLRAQVDTLSRQIAAAGTAGSSTAATPLSGLAMQPASGQGGGDANSPTLPEDERLFNAAYADYTAGRYVVAVSGFEEYLSRYPDDARAADALYWIGESLAAQGRHDEARRRFLEIPQRYVSSPKVPDAVLRAALEAVELGQRGDAVRELRQLIAAHGGSDAALVGCMQLDKMGEALPTGCRLPR